MQIEPSTARARTHTYTSSFLPPPLQLSRDFAHFVPRGATKPAICMQHASMRTRTAPISPRYPPFSSTTHDCGLTHMGNTCCHSHKPSTQRTTIPDTILCVHPITFDFFSSKGKDIDSSIGETSNYRRGRMIRETVRFLFFFLMFRFVKSIDLSNSRIS